VHRFELFAFEQYRDLETRVMGHSSSLEMTPFDRSHYDLVFTFCSNHGASLPRF